MRSDLRSNMRSNLRPNMRSNIKRPSKEKIEAECKRLYHEKMEMSRRVWAAVQRANEATRRKQLKLRHERQAAATVASSSKIKYSREHSADPVITNHEGTFALIHSRESFPEPMDIDSAGSMDVNSPSYAASLQKRKFDQISSPEDTNNNRNRERSNQDAQWTISTTPATIYRSIKTVFNIGRTFLRSPIPDASAPAPAYRQIDGKRQRLTMPGAYPTSPTHTKRITTPPSKRSHRPRSTSISSSHQTLSHASTENASQTKSDTSRPRSHSHDHVHQVSTEHTRHTDVYEESIPTNSPVPYYRGVVAPSSWLEHGGRTDRSHANVDRLIREGLKANGKEAEFDRQETETQEAIVRAARECGEPARRTSNTRTSTTAMDIPVRRPYYVQAPAMPAKTPEPVKEESPTLSLRELADSLSGVQLNQRKLDRLDHAVAKRERLVQEEIDEAARVAAAEKALEEEQERNRIAAEKAEARAAEKLDFHTDAEWDQKIDAALNMKNYFGNVTDRLTRKDLGTLLPTSMRDTGGWLNDEIVMAYLNKTVDKINDEAGWTKRADFPPPVQVLSSHLYPTYRNKGYTGVERWAQRAKVAGERLLKVKALLIPINTGNHWTLLSVSGTNKTIAYYDSLNMSSSGTYTAWAREYVSKVLGEHYVAEDWTISAITPQRQENGRDCGVFVCLNGHALLDSREPATWYAGGEVASLARRWVAAGLLGREV